MQNSKKVCIAFLGNALHDSRIVNLTNSLQEDGCKVNVISFDWFILDTAHFDETFTIYKLKKGKVSLFFYIHFAFLLIKKLIQSRADIYFAEDFYTLPFVTTFAKIRGAKIYYNSRELYAFLGGLRNRPFLQALVRTIEKFFIHKVDLVLTTGYLDSETLEKYYGIKNTLVIRNNPLFQQPTNKVDFRKLYGLSDDKIILLYQGVLLEGRGIPLILKAIKDLPKTALIILGEGEQKENFKKIAEVFKISERVIFAGSINQKDLINYTAGADIGLSLIENISVSYFHALPNKLFEYIMAGLPVLASDLPQMKQIVEDYQIGEAINIEHSENIVSTLKRWIDNPDVTRKYRENCKLAAKELNWQEEYKRTKKYLLGID